MRRRDLIFAAAAVLCALTAGFFVFRRSVLETGNWGLSFRQEGQPPIGNAGAEQLRRYVDAARVAPSGANLQPLKYVIVRTEEMTDKVFSLVKWAAYLAPDYNPKETERPTAYVVVCADTTLRKTIIYDLRIHLL